MTNSLSKWMLKLLIYFYCFAIFIPESILCQEQSISKVDTELKIEDNPKNILMLSAIKNIDSAISIDPNVEILKSNNRIEQVNDDIDEIMENLNPFSYLFHRTKRETASEYNGSVENVALTYSKNFNILISRRLKLNEFVAITGNVDELGNWDPDDAIRMNRSDTTTADNNDEMWTTYIHFENENNKKMDRVIEYRYFIGSKNSKNNKISIIEWENHVESRKYRLSEEQNTSASDSNAYEIGDVDIFGEINGDVSIDNGWLQEHETIVQFKFFRNPFNIKSFHLDQFQLKIIPYDSIDSDLIENNDFINNAAILSKPSQDVNVKFSKLKYNQSELKEQPMDGVTYNPNDILIYHIHLSNNFENINFLINLYDTESLETGKLLGYQYIKSKDLNGSEGDIELNLRNVNHQGEDNGEEIEKKNAGSIKISYLIIKPLKVYDFRFRKSFSNYWRSNWTALDVGHRGLGVSFKLPNSKKPPAIENTVTSMKQAGIAGVDMVEFDVHLTKDLIPVIYHDFTILVRKDEDEPLEPDNLERVHLQDLTYDELKSMKMYYKQNDGNIIEYKSYNDEINIEHRLFPTLEEFFDKIDPSIGFDIEIKWPQKYIDGSVEANQTLDKNLFADRILKTILENGSGRLSFLSTFDADLCTMLKYKQNMYPVMFLTMGSIHQWTSYYDPRCESAENAVTNAKTWNLFGIVAHSRDYFIDPTLIDLSFEMNQKIFCWGSDIDSSQAVEKMKEIGMTGVIYDRVDKFLVNNKISIFENDDLKILFMKQHL